MSQPNNNTIHDLSDLKALLSEDAQKRIETTQKETIKAKEEDYSNYIPPAKQSNVRSLNEKQDNVMCEFLEKKYFPALIKFGKIQDFRRGNAQEDIHGADYILTFKDGTEAKVDIKTNWSIANTDNNRLPVEILNKFRNQIRTDNYSPGWIQDMSTYINTENNKNTDIVMMIRPRRVTTNDINDVKMEDIKDIHVVSFIPDKFYDMLKKRAGIDPEQLTDLAYKTNEHYEETGNRSFTVGKYNNIHLYTSKGKLKEDPVVALIPEEEARAFMGAYQTGYYTIEDPERPEIKFKLTKFGNNPNGLHDMAKEVKQMKEKTKENLKDLKNDKTPIKFDSKNTIQEEINKTA